MADWAALPTDVAMRIAEQVYSMKEFVSFGGVCKSWVLATSTLKESTSLFPPKLPCLMLAEEKFDEENAAIVYSKTVTTRGFFDLSYKRICELNLPEISMRVILGVNYGWLFTLGYDLLINLFHPFSRDQISLPPFLSFSDQYEYDDILTPKEVIDVFILKVALSAHPKQRDCVVMAIYGRFDILAFARPGDELWTNVPVPSKCYEDVVYYRGQFYAVDCHGVVIVCDIDCNDGPKSTVIAPPPLGTEDHIQKYLVESLGDLLLILRVRGGYLFIEGEEYDQRFYTASFSILKMEECSEKDKKYPYCWVPLESLGDRTLFIGRNTSISLSASEYNGCFKANCIYFTDGNPGLHGEEEEELEALGGGDMGIFDMETGTIEPHYSGVSLSYLSPPVWII